MPDGDIVHVFSSFFLPFYHLKYSKYWDNYNLDGEIKISDIAGTIQFPVSSNHWLHEGIRRVRKRLLIGQVNLPTSLTGQVNFFTLNVAVCQ